MDKEIEDTYSLGIETFDILGFRTEQELLEALKPLMIENDFKS